MRLMSNKNASNNVEPSDIQVRDFPLDYSSMIAISTDIDDTDIASLARAHGCFYGLEPEYEDVELELANSFWIFNTEDPVDCRIYLFDGDMKPHSNTEKLAEFFKSELFDTLHTYGQFLGLPFRRHHARRAIERMSDYALEPHLWTYHGDRAQAQNLRPGDEDWIGDKPDSDAYHLDLLAKTSVRYVRLPPSLDLLDPQPVLGTTEFRDGKKMITVQGSSVIFEPENPNQAVKWIDRLSQNGQLSYEKSRILQGNLKFPHKIQTWKPEMLPYQFSQANLDTFVEQRRAVLILQHISQNHCALNFALPELRNTLKLLSRYQRAGQILVTTNVRMINYLRVRDGLMFTHDGGTVGSPFVIKIKAETNTDGVTQPLDLTDLEGIEFVIPNSVLAGGMPKVLVGKRECTDFVVRPIAGDSEHVILGYRWTSRLGQQRTLLGEWKKAFQV